MEDELENIEDLEAKDTHNKLPIGWVIFFVAVILWGIYYVASYTPSFSGWSQESEYEESIKGRLKN